MPLVRVPLTLVRVAVIGVGVFLLWAIVSVTAAGVIGSVSGAALALAPWDARGRAAQAQLEATKADRSSQLLARADAIRALRRDATAVSAVDALAVGAAVRNDLAGADRAFTYAQHLTRRAPAAQIWFIEREVQRGNIAGALRHYDIALSTSLTTRRQLFPVLFGASTTPQVASALNMMLRRRPDWRSEFLSEFVGKVDDPAALVTVTRGLFDNDDVYDRAAFATALNRLTAAGHYDAALKIYADVHGVDAARAAVRDRDFTSGDAAFPFDWSLAEDPGLSPERGRRSSGPVRTILALPPAPSQDGEVARQMVRLAPGRRVLQLMAGDIVGPVQARPRVRVTCASVGNAVLAELLLPALPEGGRNLRLAFDAPATCRWAWLSISVRSQWGQDAAAAPWITHVDLH